MALIGNYSVINKSAGRCIGGLTIAQSAGNFYKNSCFKSSYTHFGKLAAYPSGHYPPYAYSMPMTTGAMSSFTESYSLITPLANLAGGRNLEFLASSSMININADLQQIVTFIASSLMTLTSTAEINASVNLQASAILELNTVANIQAIITTFASSSMTITPNALLTALAHMNAESGGPTPLSPEGLANAVWDKILADHQITGSTGKALSDAGGAGNPWSADLASNNTSGTFGALVQKLLTVAKFIGLK